MGIGSHQSKKSKTDTWITPKEVIDALGTFDLDPCINMIMPWRTAKTMFSIIEDGLLQPWFGRVWLNPPYSTHTAWFKKIVTHNNGVVLIFNRSDRNSHHDYMYPYAMTMFIRKQRITFCDQRGEPAPANGGAPNVFYSFGEQNADALADSGFPGQHIPLNMRTFIIVGISTLPKGSTWKSVIDIAITRLNGEACVNAIYRMVEKVSPEKVKGNHNYKEKIRQQLQFHFAKLKRGYYANQSIS